MNTKKNHEISLATAIDMTTRFRAHKPAGLANSETFDAAAIRKLIRTKGCESLRIYYGMKENMEVHAIVVAADANGEDILPASASAVHTSEDDDDPIIIEDAWRCPPLCPEGSPLNEE